MIPIAAYLERSSTSYGWEPASTARSAIHAPIKPMNTARSSISSVRRATDATSTSCHAGMARHGLARASSRWYRPNARRSLSVRVSSFSLASIAPSSFSLRSQPGTMIKASTRVMGAAHSSPCSVLARSGWIIPMALMPTSAPSPTARLPLSPPVTVSRLSSFSVLLLSPYGGGGGPPSSGAGTPPSTFGALFPSSAFFLSLSVSFASLSSSSSDLARRNASAPRRRRRR
mmetsp:Transcript_37092/g.91664  ORF Transcript_37092/g.91664 Transcript_37092/m.91664 type:complete len:230 (-) Transcript_37092:173-862(-)